MYINKRKKACIDSFPEVYLVTITIFTYASKNKSLPYLLIEAKKSVTEIFIGEKEKLTNNGNDKRRRLILSYTIQVIPNVCTKFQNPRFSSS